jgi:hypothetical protein
MANYSYTQPPAQTSSLAVVSLVSGIVSWFLLPLIGAIVAVITGHMAKREIRESMGRLTGDGMATVGLVLGYINLGLSVIGGCLAIILIALGVFSPLLCLPYFNEFSNLMLNTYIGF